MISENLYDALTWAHRYIVSYQLEGSEVTKEYLKLFKDYYLPNLSLKQTAHLCWDMDKFKDANGEFNQDMSVYMDMIEKRLQEPDSTELCEYPQDFSHYLIWKWCGLYSISRLSYAHSNWSDIVPNFKDWSKEELKDFRDSIGEYLERCSHKDHIDKGWKDMVEYISQYLDSKFVEVTASDDTQTVTRTCFKDSKGYYRPVDSYLRRPYADIHADPKYIIEVK